MKYINGVIVGGTRSFTPYGHGRRHLYRLMYIWLKKIVGWSHVDDNDGDPTLSWDTPELGGAAGFTDGATDASDHKIFTSATGGFSSYDPYSNTNRYYLLVKGFTDPDRDGWYLIYHVVDDNTVYIRSAFCGSNAEGFPLSETGLTWWLYDLKAEARMPALNDWWVLAGTGVGGTFHLYSLVTSSPSYVRPYFEISPWDDWDNVAHAWKPGTRYCARDDTGWDGPYTDSGLVFAAADLTHAVVWVRWYDYDLSGGQNYPTIFYFGDIVPFRAGVDTRPVISIVRQTDSFWSFGGFYNNINMLDGLVVQTTGQLLWPNYAGTSNVYITASNKKNRSAHSGNFYRMPPVIGNATSGAEEIRGTLKSLELGHDYGDRAGTPFGTARDRLRLKTLTIPFNGSKQYRYIW